jgi:DNA-binding beta-propeller fold protein YncE
MRLRAKAFAPLVALMVAVGPASAARADQHLYLADATNGEVLGFNVSSLGTVTALPNSPYPAGGGASAVALSPDGATLWAANGTDNTVSTFSVGSTGALTAVGSPVGTGGATPAAIAVSPDGAHVYVVNQAAPASVAIFDVGPGGSLTAHADTVAITGTMPRGIAVSPDGRSAYIAVSDSGMIQGYSIGAGGGLSTLGDPVNVGGRPYWISIDPNGSTIYVTDNLGGGFRLLTRNTSTGVLTPVSQLVSAGDHPEGSAISARGYAFAAATGGGEIWRTNLLSQGPSSSSLGASFASATSLAASPGGDLLFAVGAHALAGWRVGANGSLASLGAATDTGATASHLAGAMVFAPDQPPRAAFSAAPSIPGTYTSFDASASSDADGYAAHFNWDFGDGESATDGGPTPKHAYLKPGTYTVRLTVTDDAGCSTDEVFTGQTMSCPVDPAAATTRTVTIENAPQPPIVNNDIPCVHDGDDGFCGTPDHKAPQVTVLVIRDGANYSLDGAPLQVVGTVSNDPSGIAKIDMLFARLTSAAKTVKVKVPIKAKEKRKTRGTSAKKKKKKYRIVLKHIPAKCQVLSPNGFGDDVNCSSGRYFTFSHDAPFVYEIPGTLSAGSYTLKVIATDGAGNVDTLEQGRNQLTFKVSRNGTASIDSTITTT